MWPLIIAIFTVGLTALVHRYRGEGAKYFERWTVAVVITVGMYFFSVALLGGDDVTDIVNSLMTGIGMYIFLCQPWGRWYTVGNAERDLGGPPSGYERIIEFVFSFVKDRKTSDVLCWLLSAYIFALPLIITNGLWVALPPLMITLYAFSWSLSPTNYVIRNAETASGALFGGLALLSGYVTYSPGAKFILDLFR